MVRSILVGLLVISAAAACKGGGAEAPAVEPGATVGKVLEVSGKVTATRGTVTRDLDATSTVSGDDVIKTSADGRISILLAHNNARWDLGPGKQQQVSEGLAWRLAKADSPATAVDETTTAGGRHAERSAATAESAAAPAAKADDERADNQRAEPVASSTEAVATGAPATPAPPAPPPPPPPTGGGSEDGAAPREPAPGGSAPDGPSPGPRPTQGTKGSPRQAAVTQEKQKARTAFDDISAGDPAEGGRARAPAKVASPAKDAIDDKKVASEGDGTEALQAAIEKERAAIRTCVVASGKDRLALVFHVVKGKVSIDVTGGTAADRACLAKVAARIKLTVDPPTARSIVISK